MINDLEISIKKKDLILAFRRLSLGFRYHRKYQEEYTLAFSVLDEKTIIVEVLGAQCYVPAKIMGNSSFSIPYLGMKRIITSVKERYILLELKNGVLTINKKMTINIVSQLVSVPKVHLSVEYSAADLLRTNKANISPEVMSFWRLDEQVNSAEEVIEADIKRAYLLLVPHIPRNLSYKTFKEKVYKELLEIR